MAMEFGNTGRRLGFTIGQRQSPRLYKVMTTDVRGLMEEIHLSKVRFDL